MKIQPYKGTVNQLLGDYPDKCHTAKGRKELLAMGWDSSKFHELRNFINGLTRHKYTKFYTTQFVALDGEGVTVNNNRHNYFLFANSEGEYVKDFEGISSDDCFQFILDSSSYNRTLVIFGGSYDFNMWLKDLPIDNIIELQKTNKTVWYPYIIKSVPRKYFTIQLLSMEQGKNKVVRTATVWDVIGFFQMKFTDAIQEYLDVKGEDLEYIMIHKDERSDFTLTKFDEILTYCNLELEYLVKIMTKFQSLCNDLGLRLSRFDGAGAIATCIYRNQHTKACLNQEIDIEATQFAYSAGRIECVQQGNYKGVVYKYDLHSAYPSVIATLPSLKGAQLVEAEEITPMGLYNISYKDNDPNYSIMHPYFHREKNMIYYPYQTIGWHYGSEIVDQDGKLLPNTEILYGYELELANDDKPFEFVEDYYRKRYELKAKNDRGEKVIKLGLNSLYGKMAQHVGYRTMQSGEVVPPTFHQLYYAGYITGSTRAKIWNAIKDNLEDIIAIETDGIFSTKPLPVTIGTNLGEWEEEIYDEILYVQTGVYWLRKGDKWYAKNRGLDTGALTREEVLETYQAIPATLDIYARGESTKFVTYGSAMSQNTWMQWNTWIKETKEISVIPEGKRKFGIDTQVTDYKNCTNQLIRSYPKVPQQLYCDKYLLPWYDGVRIEEIDEFQV